MGEDKGHDMSWPLCARERASLGCDHPLRTLIRRTAAAGDPHAGLGGGDRELNRSFLSLSSQ